MGLFSRNKGQQQQPQQQQQPAQAAAPATPPPAPSSRAHSASHPPGPRAPPLPPGLPYSTEVQQQLFHQHYQHLRPQQQQQEQQFMMQQQQQQQQQQMHAQQQQHAEQQDAHYQRHPDDPAAAAADGGGDGAWLYDAVHKAAAAGKPLTLDFVAQMQPVMGNQQYGIMMPHQHPYGGDAPYEGGAPNPYGAIRIPALPDMRSLPPELQDFRDQCAAGVRQAVAMITAMEHQLFWERSRRQQAEEDCKVLLAAVHSERGVGEALLGAEERRRLEAAAAEGKLTLAADQLPQASEAATTIQKHVRGRLARKEFETHLRDILRGVDPLLDPAALPAAAQHHVSAVNATGAPRKLGLRSALAAAGADVLPPEKAEEASYYRRQVDRIGHRLSGHRDAGEPPPGGDPSIDPLHADVKQLLTGTYPASTAQVIAALVRRCRELQSALLEAVGELTETQLSNKGLREANGKLSELSAVRADLEAARQDNLRLAGTVAKLRSVLTAQAAGANASAARENPHVAAWYRRAYAEKEWQRVPPGGPGGVALMDGPDTEVELWDDLRASIPEPVLMPRVAVPGAHYRDLLGLKQDMIMAAGRGPPDPLYSMPVPDRSAFVYERDTPLVPMQSAMPIIRESMLQDTFVGVHDDLYRRPSAPGAGSQGGGNLLPTSAANLSHAAAQQPPGAYRDLLDRQTALAQQAEWEAQHGGGSPYGSSGGGGAGGARGPGSFSYNRDTPVVPVYSVLPLIREDEYIRRSSSPGREASPPPTPPPQPYHPQPAPSQHGTRDPTPAASHMSSYQPHPSPSMQPSQQAVRQPGPMRTNLQHVREPGYPLPSPQYARPPSQQGSVRGEQQQGAVPTNMPYVREPGHPPPTPPYASVQAAREPAAPQSAQVPSPRAFGSIQTSIQTNLQYVREPGYPQPGPPYVRQPDLPSREPSQQGYAREPSNLSLLRDPQPSYLQQQQQQQQQQQPSYQQYQPHPHHQQQQLQQQQALMPQVVAAAVAATGPHSRQQSFRSVAGQPQQHQPPATPRGGYY